MSCAIQITQQPFDFMARSTFAVSFVDGHASRCQSTGGKAFPVMRPQDSLTQFLWIVHFHDGELHRAADLAKQPEFGIDHQIQRWAEHQSRTEPAGQFGIRPSESKQLQQERSLATELFENQEIFCVRRPRPLVDQAYDADWDSFWRQQWNPCEEPNAFESVR